MMKEAILLASILLISGCKLGIPTVIGSSVGYYCAIPQETRSVVRQGIDLRTYPNKVRIECYDGGKE